ncbi:glycoside hydrolase family 3 C-terminal domain-containing protein [Lacrimispora indolis]|uniref:glycoside hydrolase family 3 C-terminal domain-containing protein n=1 Tax=Lacrimispora indolis TaxID=69825 RepID=UPI00041DCF2C|nr:glycoside hydrolase family 3 C-terminal domain-containing protein [[Clostridium] methoxybenzovorans]
MYFEERARELVGQMTLEEKASQLRFDAPAVKRLGIPRYHWWNESLHGVARAGTATMFPQAIGMAAMFDEEMMKEIGTAAGMEARAKYNAYSALEDRDIYKGLTLWSPNVNIFRDPRWGRGHETYGEDPYLSGRLGVGFIQGIQGEGEYLLAAACAKHFAVHSGPEEQRHTFDARVSKKDLWETYLPAFEACVSEGKVEGVMGAYNRTNGEPCCGSKTLIQDILKEKWKFDGYFVSDCWAIKDFHENHHVTDTAAQSAAMALRNGCDINCGNTYLHILSSYEQGLVTEEEITEAAVHAMRTRMRLGLFDEDCPYNQIPYETVGCKKHRKLAIRAAEKSMVLLKNDGILPLDKKLKRVAVIGPNADSRWPLIANYHGTAPRYVTVLDGIENFLDEDTRIFYSEGCHTMKDRVERLALPGDRISEAVAAALEAGLAIVCVGLDERYEGEQQDLGNRFDETVSMADKPSLALPESQRLLLTALIETGVPLVVINMSGSAMDLAWLDQAECVKAILQAWYPGAEGGTAVARILFGETSPSGRLPVTFYRSEKELPPYEDYRMKNRTYRYMKEEALYPFGFGLSYSSFRYRDLECVPADGGSVSISVKVRNEGPADGEEVVQVYVKNLDSSLAVRNHSLCAFARVSLAKGQERKVSFSLPGLAFCVVDQDGNRKLDGYRFDIYAGGSQPDSRSCLLMGAKPLRTRVEL